MAVNKLGALTVALLIVAISAPSALISESRPGEGQCEQQRHYSQRYQVLSVLKKSHTILQIGRSPLQPTHCFVSLFSCQRLGTTGGVSTDDNHCASVTVGKF